MTTFKNPYEAFQFINNLWEQYPHIMDLDYKWNPAINTKDGLAEQVSDAMDRQQSFMILYFLDPSNIDAIAKIPMPNSLVIELPILT
jgi:hypothetical protein